MLYRPSGWASRHHAPGNWLVCLLLLTRLSVSALLVAILWIKVVCVQHKLMWCDGEALSNRTYAVWNMIISSQGPHSPGSLMCFSSLRLWSSSASSDLSNYMKLAGWTGWCNIWYQFQPLRVISKITPSLSFSLYFTCSMGSMLDFTLTLKLNPDFQSLKSHPLFINKVCSHLSLEIRGWRLSGHTKVQTFTIRAAVLGNSLTTFTFLLSLWKCLICLGL